MRHNSPQFIRYGTSQRGAVLGIVIITALICSIIAYAVLVLARSQARRSRAFQGRMEARYLSEAGFIIATNRLRQDPNYPGCTTPGDTKQTTERVDTNGDQVGDRGVLVEVTNCGAGRNHTINVQTEY